MPSQINLSVMRALEVLQVTASQKQPVGSRELARLLEDDHTRVLRMLQTLAATGMLSQDAKKRYLPGPGIHILAAKCLYNSGLLQAALPVLDELHQSGCYAAMGVLWKGEVSYLYHGDPQKRFAHGLTQHPVYPAEASSIGHVIEAHDSTGASFLSATQRRMIIKQGYAMIQSDEAGASIAVPIIINEQVVAGLARVGRTTSTTRDTHVCLLQDAAKQIQSVME